MKDNQNNRMSLLEKSDWEFALEYMALKSVCNTYDELGEINDSQLQIKKQLEYRRRRIIEQRSEIRQAMFKSENKK